ncbi:MAG: CCA tRNA nucleotidyltransferase [Clostridia bacterium]|nr:CCA tRNA nucleotidyltransferase [Clostridia bacterium]
MSREIARRVAQRGGCAYFVGGFVRDMLMNVSSASADVDIEVHGLRPEELGEVLSGLGEVVTMGVSFGVFSLRHYNIDIAMPRREHATGRGHKDFAVFVDPFIGAENAARRRDFTINALMQNVLTGEVLDFFGGQDDLKRGVLRHVDDESFVEDPLRVFRLAQFASRFGFSVDPCTAKLCSRMDVKALSRERVFGEVEKALLKSADPSIFFRVLYAIGQSSVWFPEIGAYLSGGQDSGLSRVLSGAAEVSGKTQNKLGFMCAALSSAIASRGRPVSAWLRRISSNRKLIRYCDNTSRACLALLLRRRPRTIAARERLLLNIYDAADEPADALLLAGTVSRTQGVPGDEEKAALSLYLERVSRPAVTGRDLIAAGIEPGPVLGAAVKYGEKLRLMGIEKDEALKTVLKKYEDGEL